MKAFDWFALVAVLSYYGMAIWFYLEDKRKEATTHKRCDCGKPITDHPHSPICLECWNKYRNTTERMEDK